MPLWLMLAIGGISATSAIYMFRLIAKNPGAAPWADDEPGEALLAGHIENWPDKRDLDSLLRVGGLETIVGAHSIRIKGFESFVFRDLNGTVPPSITADHENVDALIAISADVSKMLAAQGIRHHFDILDETNNVRATFPG